MRFAEVIGLVMPHTAKPMGIKKISKGGRTFYVPINPDPRRGEGNQVIVKNSFADGKKKGLGKIFTSLKSNFGFPNGILRTLIPLLVAI